jgi:hypothetical protein
MKLALVVLSLACTCLALPAEIIQKRSVYGEGWIGGSIAAPSISTLSLAPSISTVSLTPTITSHTHTHSTAIIDRAVPVAVHTPTITTSSIIPSTYSTYKNYGLSGYGYPYATSYPSISYNKFYPSYSKYYSSYPTTIYKKSYYSSPLIKSYKW